MLVNVSISWPNGISVDYQVRTPAWPSGQGVDPVPWAEAPLTLCPAHCESPCSGSPLGRKMWTQGVMGPSGPVPIQSRTPTAPEMVEEGPSEVGTGRNSGGWQVRDREEVEEGGGGMSGATGPGSEVGISGL